MRRFHNVMFRLFGHRYCCDIPSWTAHVGFKWEPIGDGRPVGEGDDDGLGADGAYRSALGR
jgi:hypothetical protein